MPTNTPLALRAYLRMRADSCVNAAGEACVMFLLRDVGGAFPTGLRALWVGDDAIDFFERHSSELASGRCVDVSVYDIHAMHNEVRARVKTCQLAPIPPSWAKHAERQAGTAHAAPQRQAAG